MSLSMILACLGEIASAFSGEDFTEEVADSFLDYAAECVGELHGKMCELSRCESPIEQQFFIEWMRQHNGEPWYIRPQKRYHLGDKVYRADFSVITKSSHEVVIECDGHDFHEKTKEQAKMDKARDRAFQSANIPIFHFTGSEIYRDVFHCVKEVTDFLSENHGEPSSG